MQGPYADVDLLYEVGELRTIARRYPYGSKFFNAAEHTLRVTYIALILARKTPEADLAKVLQIALMHDLPEVRTGDQTPWQKPFVEVKDDEALADMLAGTALEDMRETLAAYRRREGLEAELVKDAT